MKYIVIIGAGSQGRDIAEVISHPDYPENQKLLGFIDEKKELHNTKIDGYPVLGNWSWFENNDLAKIEVIGGSGFSETRKKIAEKAARSGLKFANVISPRAYLAADVELGVGNYIGHGAIICRGSRIDDHTIINYGSQISHDNQIGDFATINPQVGLAGNVSVGEGTYIGIGANVIQGVSIGKWTIIGAGAVVIGDLPDEVTAVGVPARIIKRHHENEQ